MNFTETFTRDFKLKTQWCRNREGACAWNHSASSWRKYFIYREKLRFMERSCYLFLEISCKRPPVFKKLILEMDTLSYSFVNNPKKKKSQLGYRGMIFLDRYLENLSPHSSVYAIILSCLCRCLDALLLTPQKKISMFSFETAFQCQGNVSGWIHTLEMTSSAY